MKPLLLPVLEKPDELVDQCLRHGRKEAGQPPKNINAWVTARTRAKIFIGASTQLFIDKLEDAQKKIPTIEELPAFEKEYWHASVDMPAVLRALGQLRAAQKIGKRVRIEAYRRIGKIPANRFDELKSSERHFAGRFSSVVRSLAASVRIYNSTRQAASQFPSIDSSMPTMLLAGVPNAGKSTIMQRLTGARVEIAHYPFTTKTLNVAYFDYRYLRIQVIDTPGLLDRPESKRNDIEQKAISALRHVAGMLLFVVDPTQKGDQGLDNQRRLLDEIHRSLQPTMVKIVLNKLDTADAEDIANARNLFSVDIESREGDACEWREILARDLLARERVKHRQRPAT